MKFDINKKVLSDALKKVNRAISNRVIVEVLKGVLIVAKGDTLSLTGSNADLSIKIDIHKDEDNGLNIEQEGGVVLPAKELIQIVRSMPESRVYFSNVDTRQVVITSGKSKFAISGQESTSYPRLPKVDNEMSFEVKGEHLNNLIEKTIHSVSDFETRPILTGINLTLKNSQLTAISTDAHRLSKVENVDVQIDESVEDNVTVPGETIKEVPKLISDSSDVKVYMTANQIGFKTDHILVLSRLLEGTYPETSRLIPTNSKTILKVDRKSFMSSIERANILASDGNNNAVKFEITDKSKGLFNTIQLSHRGELGESKEEILVNDVEGDELEISFNSNYMVEALKVIEDDEVVIQFTGAMRPFVIKPSNLEEKTLQLILPIRTF